jgi:hypothetical protein
LALDGRPCQGFDAKPALARPAPAKAGFSMAR